MAKDLDKLKIAIVHDYLIDFGGAERVLLTLHEMFPKAPVYVSIYRPKLLGSFAKEFKSVTVKQSWFGYLPYAQKLISPFRFLIPLIWKSLNLKEYDLIISSSSWAITKGFDKKQKALEICYCHTPPRYLYGYDTSRKFSGFLGKMVNIYALVINHFMRMYDFESAQKVDYFIANSKEVQKRIEKFYRRQSEVIYPPIEVSDVKVYEKRKRDYYLTGGRLTAAKNFDIIIKAFNKLKLPLKIYGDGILIEELKSLANKNIEFLGKVSDEELKKLYMGAKAFILAQKDEDFGMTSMEAQSYGCPIVAYRGGGYLESVVEGQTGVFFDELNEQDLAKSVKKFNSSNNEHMSANCVSQARIFNKETFIQKLEKFLIAKLASKQIVHSVK